MGPRTTAEVLGLGKGPSNGVAKPAAPKKDDLESAWKDWSTNRDDAQATQRFMQAANPVINSAITSYAPNSSPAVRSQAKILVRRAANSYDPKKGVKFSTYLHTQLQPLRREALSYNTVYMPERVRMDLSALNAKNNEFVDANGYEPSDTDLADYTGLSTKRINHLRKYDRQQVSEQSLQAAGDDDPRHMPNVETISLWEDYVYDGLGDIDKRIYDLKTGKHGTQRGLSVNEIAKKLKLSPSAVSQRTKRVADLLAEGAQYEQS